MQRRQPDAEAGDGDDRVYAQRGGANHDDEQQAACGAPKRSNGSQSPSDPVTLISPAASTPAARNSASSLTVLANPRDVLL